MNSSTKIVLACAVAIVLISTALVNYCFNRPILWLLFVIAAQIGVCVRIIGVVGGLGIPRLRRKICRRLDSDGYKWEMHDGDLRVFKDEICFDVVMWDMGVNERNKRTYFLYHYASDRINDMNQNGLVHLAALTNNENPHVAMVVTGDDSFCCRFCTCTSDVDDFMQEFLLAYKKIGEAVTFFWTNFDAAKQCFPAGCDTAVVGFVRSSNVPEKACAKITTQREH